MNSFNGLRAQKPQYEARFCNWSLPNRSEFRFKMLAFDVNWSERAGLYIFAKPGSDGWYAQYIGQTDCFSTRIPTHERWNEARQLGATSVHAVVVASKFERDELEKMLIATYMPPLNTHHR